MSPINKWGPAENLTNYHSPQIKSNNISKILDGDYMLQNQTATKNLGVTEQKTQAHLAFPLNFTSQSHMRQQSANISPVRPYLISPFPKSEKSCLQPRIPKLEIDFSFNIIKDVRKVSWKNMAPWYREICNGFSWICYCTNPTCDAF